MNAPIGNNSPPSLSREEIRAIYDQGPEGVIDLIEALLVTVSEQAKMIASLTDRVQELEARLSKNSHNSSKPPSSDGLSKKPSPKSLRPKGKRPSGGQHGHRGSTLRMSENPKHVIRHAPTRCTHCDISLGNVVPEPSYERRQVYDLPPLAIEVTEHQRLAKVCPGCGCTHHGDFPPGVSQPAQYGERIKSLGVYLTTQQLIPSERTCQILMDLFGCSLSEATLQLAVQNCASELKPITEQIKQAIQKADVAHFDETGQRIAGKLHWLHSASTDKLTYYYTHQKRGRQAMDEIGILPGFNGRAMHDGWKPYLHFLCRHGSCNAHHLRELTFLAEELGQIWAQRMITLLCEIKDLIEHYKKHGKSALDALTISEFETRFGTLIQNGFDTNPKNLPSIKRGRDQQSKGRNLLTRLQCREQVLAFMYDFDVPFDNNLAERDIRMMKLKQKISGTFRTMQGAQNFATIRTYISTMRKQGHNPLTVLQTTFQANPRAPAY